MKGSWRTPKKVYPRVCGGTAGETVRANAAAGLSPRVRGNRMRCHRRTPVAGSIPACAGEPAPAFRPSRTLPVYPRVCGGTAAI